MKEQLILIASAPRSGSTWFSNLFNSHPAMLYRHEPLARLAHLIDPDMLHRLKYCYGISEEERSRLLAFLRRANPECDRPPFFVKSYFSLPPQLRFLFWVTSTKVSRLRKLYEELFSRVGAEAPLVIKETGWSIHLESIMCGLKPTKTILLLRHPCAIIASILRGIDSHHMKVPNGAVKMEWYIQHRAMPYLVEQKISERDVIEADTVMFWALRLRVLFDLFVAIAEKDISGVLPIVYEEIQDDPLRLASSLFATMNIPFDDNVARFVGTSTGRVSAPLQPLQKMGKDGYFSVHRQRGYNPWQWKEQLSAEIINLVRGIIGTDLLYRFWPLSQER